MTKTRVEIGGIPALIWGEPSDRVYLCVHGKMSSKLAAEGLAEIAAERGYQMALNGRGVRVVGGGAAQVAAAMYLAVRDMENVEILEMESYGDRYAGYYVEDGADAVLVDYGSGVDFTFINTGESDISFYIYVEDDWLVCEVYEGQ